jgi:hypothetical protein
LDTAGPTQYGNGSSPILDTIDTLLDYRTLTTSSKLIEARDFNNPPFKWSLWRLKRVIVCLVIRTTPNRPVADTVVYHSQLPVG